MFYLQANSQYSPIHLFLTKYTSPLCHVKGPCNPQETLTTWQILPWLFIFLISHPANLIFSCFQIWWWRILTDPVTHEPTSLAVHSALCTRASPHLVS